MSAIFGELLTYPQENGPSVQLYTFGDEFYARRETLDGYTTIYDQDQGRYCYAILMGGRFTSSGTPIFKKPPAGLQRRLKETEDVRNQKFDQRFRLLRGLPSDLPLDIAFTLGRENGLLEGRQVNTGNVRGLTILVEFADEGTSVTSEDLNAMLNAEDFTANGNFCSVRKYYELMSSGKLNYTNDVIGPVKLPKRKFYYKSNKLMKDAVELAIDQFDIDFSRYDSRDEGMIDALSFVYAGRTVYEGWLWPHNFSLNETFNGYQANLYTIQSGGRSAIDLTIGTFCHESGHLLCRFPDLYDYGKRDGDFERSAGLGRYCLMSSGNHLDFGRTPSPICAYLRMLAGWYGELVDLSRERIVQCRHGQYDRILKFPTDLPNEYFLIENRSQLGLDRALPSSGLAVYHCDILGSNEWQGGTETRHYQVGLLQADGHLDLERNRNQGDSTDLYQNARGEALSDTTVPNSLKWSGAASDLYLSDISISGNEMAFCVGDPEDDQLVTRSEEATVVDQTIPMKQQTQAVAEFTIRKSRKINDISIEIEGIGDDLGELQLTLQGPEDEFVELGAVGNRGRQFAKTFNLDSVESLSTLIGKSGKGKWKVLASNFSENSEARIDRMEINFT